MITGLVGPAVLRRFGRGEIVYRHASIWGIAQREAKKAVGTVTIEGVPGTVLPSGIEIAAGDATAYVTTSGGTIGIGGAVTVSAEAAIAGSSGNLEAGIRLVTIAPYPEITRITVATAFRGGTDEMSPEELQQATLQRIRHRPMAAHPLTIRSGLPRWHPWRP